MTDYKDPLFSINIYDYEGDVNEFGLYLHLGDCVKLKFDNPEDLKAFGEKIVAMATGKELNEQWSN